MGDTTNTKWTWITFPRLIIAALILLVLLMGAWILLRSMVVKNLLLSVQNLEADGYEVTHGGLNLNGFPFTIKAETSTLSIAAPRSLQSDVAKNWSLQAKNTQLKTATLYPLSWRISHRGSVRIDLRVLSGERYMFDVNPSNIDGRAVYSLGGVMKSARLDINHAQIDSLIGTPPIVTKFGDTSARLSVKADKGHVIISTQNIGFSPKLDPGLSQLLGRKLSRVDLDVTVSDWARLQTQDLPAWIAQGGQISASHWRVLWGDVDVIGTFDIKFVEGLPEGVVVMHFQDPKKIIKKAEKLGLLPKNYSDGASAMLTLTPTAEDGRKTITLTLKDGIVKMGFIELFKL